MARNVRLLWLLLPVALLAPAAAQAQTSSATAADSVERAEQLRELQRMREDLARSLERIEQQVNEIDARIGALEENEQRREAQGAVAGPRPTEETDARLLGGPEEQTAQANPVRAPPRAGGYDAAPGGAREPDAEQGEPGRDPDRPPPQAPGYDVEPGRPRELDPDQEPYDPGPGIVLARGPLGEATLGLRGYVRYLNQLPLSQFFTDSFGRTFKVDRRQDFQLNRLQILTRGWLFDPRLRWSFYAWTQNVSQGDPAQVVVGGNMTYAFNEALNVQAGIFSVPSTRSTTQSFPNWLRIDHRTMADEYFRGSYSQGVLVFGKLTDDLAYSASLTDNLSILGVSAEQLDNDFDTYTFALWWMPTTGEYGPAAGFGDYEYHEELATLFGVRHTYSREDRQEQPGVNSFENAQIRLSDGTLLFSPNAFNTGGTIEKATYRMLDLDAGVKYRGWSFDAEYYFRWLNDFNLLQGTIPVTSLFDQGYQVQLSTMLHRDVLQGYASGSKIVGAYGHPWDVAFGLNYFPFHRKEVRLNVQALFMNRSAVGYTAIPYEVGGDGWVWTIDFGYWF